MPYQPLDFVKTPGGAFAIITETNNDGAQASIAFIGPNPQSEKNAWWRLDDRDEKLTVLASLPAVIASATSNPFGSGRDDARKFFPARKV